MGIVGFSHQNSEQSPSEFVHNSRLVDISWHGILSYSVFLNTALTHHGIKLSKIIFQYRIRNKPGNFYVGDFSLVSRCFLRYTESWTYPCRHNMEASAKRQPRKRQRGKVAIGSHKGRQQVDFDLGFYSTWLDLIVIASSVLNCIL